ncbi:DUF4405 domain-containing protein [Clostridium sp. MCC353]|uniref:DUF4405 domain-containing protein n=1 Tax=Clostridium sp. MCC353 TaxID=2592646 RepID=UPI001C0310CF|nr:DUF4405 domain-containing protein [Clostridium sp. MCC353]MBT9779849.1 DUF4405 domain-containing protein [Clostridium sp. MCC353]
MVNSKKIFRCCLNFSMLIAILGTVPYILDGQTQYRHEVFGVTAFVLMAYHCIENRLWFVQMFKKRRLKQPDSRAVKFRYWINLLLAVSTLILLISGIMISNIVFRFLRIPYHEFWHYVHFASGVLFLILVTIHAWNHRR